jgi:dimethylargininase
MKYALVRGVPASFDRCIKPEDDPQSIDVPLARQQHRRYCEILSELGRTVLFLPPDDKLPDCPFVEDTAVVAGSRALITRPGAESRRGEVTATAEVLGHFLDLARMEAPAILDGGDVLRVDDTIFVGRTERTNDAGIRALAEWAGESWTVVPVELSGALHLKTIVNALDGNTVVISGGGVDPDIFSSYKVLEVPVNEAARLSFLPVGGHVLLPMDCPETGGMFQEEGFTLIPLDISEIRKAQAGLTCMSVLFEA